MRCASSLGLLGSLILAGASASAIPSHSDLNYLESRQHTDPKSCVTSGVHVIAAPGEGQKHGHLDLLGPLAHEVVKAIPGSDLQPLQYPFPHNQTDGERITVAGALILHRYLESYTKSCPKSKIVLLGYSAGAIIVMNTLCGQSAPYEPTPPLPKSYASHIVAVVLYGDETREPGQPYDRGTCLLGHGTLGRPRTSTCAPFASSIASYCDLADGQCCTDGTNAPQGHFEYPKIYDKAATRFVVQKFNGE